MSKVEYSLNVQMLIHKNLNFKNKSYKLEAVTWTPDLATGSTEQSLRSLKSIKLQFVDQWGKHCFSVFGNFQGSLGLNKVEHQITTKCPFFFERNFFLSGRNAQRACKICFIVLQKGSGLGCKSGCTPSISLASHKSNWLQLAILH